jgi:hypothetical protein
VRASQRIGTRAGQAWRVILLTVGKQPCIGGDRRAAKLKHQAAVEIEPQRTSIPFTRRVPPFLSRSIPHKMLDSNA